MRLTSDIGLVGGGNFGFNLSAPLDCHVYLIDGGDELAIVDAGLGGPHGATETILANIRDDGYDLDRISTLILTHYHADHAGGAAEFRHRLGVEVAGEELTARTLEIGDEDVISLPFAKAAGFYPADYVYEPCPVGRILREGESFAVGRLKVTPFETPGHSRGHLSFLVEGGDRSYLIGGDLVFFGGTIIAQNIHDCSIQEYGESMKKMAGVEFDALLPGHLSISLRDGKRHVDLAAAAFGKLMIPRNAV
ncbi:MAG: hydroxyacylglutathione hydrolase [Thermomicrobiales bacterium]|nr:hydroxyacylglutathione hydrolase [Thermomicrobiales bacterium]